MSKKEPPIPDVLGVGIRATLYGATTISREELRLLRASAWREGYWRGKEDRKFRLRKRQGIRVNPYGGEL